MRHINGGFSQALVQHCQLGAHVSAQLGIQVGERLIEQEHRRLPHDRTANRNPLTLASGELFGLALQQMGDVQYLGSIFHAPVNLRLGSACQLQSKTHVLRHVHMGIKRIVLEHHGNVARHRGHLGHVLAVDENPAFTHLFQPRNHAQRGGFAAARFTQQHHEFTLVNIQV